MASTIKIKRSSVPSKIPTTSDIATGELAINTKDRKIYSSNGTAVFSFTSDYLQVANAVATYTTKASPTTSGVLAHTGRATISTNLTVSGNTVIGKLVANGSLGTSGYALKSNGSTVYWDAVGSGAGGGSTTQYLQVANAVAIYQTKAVERSALANTNSYIATKAALSGATFTGDVSFSSNIYAGIIVGNNGLLLEQKNPGSFLSLKNNGYEWKIYPSGPMEAGGALIGGSYGANRLDLTGAAVLEGGNFGTQIKSSSDRTTYKTWDFGANSTLTLPSSGNISANGSTGTAGYYLRTGSGGVYWSSVSASGASGASWAALTSTNTAIRTLVSDRLQVANAAAIYQTKSVERAALANTNLAITNVKTGLTTTNTAVRLLVSDRLQVANAVILYASKYDSQYLLTGTTTNATETELLIGGVSRVSVTSGKTAYYTIDIVARRTDTTGDHAAFRLQGVVNNNAGTVTDIGSIFETIIYRSNANYLVDARADNTNDSINIYVTGVAGHTLSWRAIITIMQV